MSLCGVCDKDLPRDGSYVNCHSCGSEYHFECSGVSQRTWKSKTQTKKSEWKCQSCRTGSVRNDSVESEDLYDANYFALKRLIEKNFKKQEQIIINKVNEIENLVSNLENKISGVLKKVKELETSSLSLKRDIEDLKISLECQKQYSRSRNFIIDGLPPVRGQEVKDQVIKLLSALAIEVRGENLSVHILPAKNKANPGVIVQLPSRELRDSIVRKARKLKPKLSLINDELPDRPIYINDHLTPYFAKLFYECKKFKINKGYNYIWMNGEYIMLKKNDDSRPIRVTRYEDLQESV